MHHGMGVSMGDHHGDQTSTMQPRNGVCSKIENYISELGEWYVRFSRFQRIKWSKGAVMSSHPQAGGPCINGEGTRRDTPGMKVAGVSRFIFHRFSYFSSNIRFCFNSSFLFLIYLTNELFYLGIDRYSTQICFYRIILYRLLTDTRWVNRSFFFYLFSSK